MRCGLQDLVRQIRFLATIRNKLVHERGFNEIPVRRPRASHLYIAMHRLTGCCLQYVLPGTLLLAAAVKTRLSREGAWGFAALAHCPRAPPTPLARPAAVCGACVLYGVRARQCREDEA